MYCRPCVLVLFAIALIAGLLLALILPFAITLLLIVIASVCVWQWNCRR
ncbi:MAG: hypothetical protein FWE06_08240 [Oscillospiraceae bacterium]|nr:hypothetical protein [Oscillospiraceae bacterium]